MKFNLIDFLKLPSSIMSAISLASGIVLFLPESILSKLYMIEFRSKYGFVIGVVFIVSTSILLIGIMLNIYKIIKNKYTNKIVEKNTKKLLINLDIYKKAIVYMLYITDNNTYTLPLNDGAVAFLEQWMVIQKATTQYFVTDMQNPQFPYFLQPWVIEKLNEDEELLLSFKEAAEKQVVKNGMTLKHKRY